MEHPGDIIRFCDESNMFVALDETIDDIKDQLLDRLSIFAHPRIVATVSKERKERNLTSIRSIEYKDSPLNHLF